MFVFSPKFYNGPAGDTVPVKVTEITDTANNRIYNLIIYGVIRQEHPLIFIIPPDIGSAASIDLICSSLYEEGLTVITYSRKGYDSPLITENGIKHFSSFGKFLSNLKIIGKTIDPDSVNEQGIILENERRMDIEFLLPRLNALIKRENVFPPVFLAGYGAGGSALVYLAGEKDFSSRINNMLGVIAMESRLWTASSGQYVDAEEFQHANFPILYIVSGNAVESQKENNPYQAVFERFRYSSNPAAITAVESAGPLDYQDFPLTHPVYSFFFPGKKDVKKSENPVSDTAGIISNFASYLLERNGFKKLPHKVIKSSLYTESKGLSGFKIF
jgi:hypothetical protein